MRYDFFFRAESNRHDPKATPARSMTLDLPAGTTLADALVAARENGMPRGSHRTGCFEVQTDAGIYSQVDGNRIDLSTPKRAAKTSFKTWKQLDSED